MISIGPFHPPLSLNKNRASKKLGNDWCKLGSNRTASKREKTWRMCWNIESSVISAVYGYLVSMYLYKRNYSVRDSWYAVFLATFTTTQGNKLFNMFYLSFCKSIRLLLQLILTSFNSLWCILLVASWRRSVFWDILLLFQFLFFFFFCLQPFPLIHAIMILASLFSFLFVSISN